MCSAPPLNSIWRSREIANSNIDTVNESKLKDHATFKDSASIHLNKCIVTGILFIPTSINENIAIIVVTNIQVHVIN